MIGQVDPAVREVTVVGGGFAGLLIGDALARAGHEVTVLEESNRAGGLLETRDTSLGMAEGAAHSILVSPPVRTFFDGLGVELLDAREKARFILRDGKLRRFPLSPLEAADLIWRISTRRGHGGIATMEDWASEFLGDAGRDYLISPLLRGIYGAEPGQIGVQAAFPSFAVPPGERALATIKARRRQRQPGSRARVAAPARGLGEVVEKLATRLGPRLKLGARVAELPFRGNVVLAVPAGRASELLQGTEPALARAAGAVAYTPLISVTAFVPAAGAPRGVGVLCPRAENRRCLGVLFNSSSFKGRVRSEEHASLTLMFRGPLADAETAAAAELEALFGIRPLHLEVFRHERAIPVYSPELPNLWKLARETWCSRPGRVLFGNYTGQVSLRGMIETVQSGQLAAE
jgi:oxygen-dependent protoporphyrinogen oxidase